MSRSVLSFGGIFLVAVAVLIFGLQYTGWLDIAGLFRPLPTVDAAFQRGFRSDSMAKINRLRSSMGVEEVKGDEELQNFINDWVSRHPDPENIELDSVFTMLQAEYPGAQYLAANLISSNNRDELLSEMTGWSAVANTDFDTINTAVFRSGFHLGALGVMSRRIPEFNLDVANSEGGKFHNSCPHCGKTHALEIDRDSRTLILSCPYCELPFDVLAADTSGTIRRACDFFEGFTLVEDARHVETLSPEQRIVFLWGRIADRCDYQLDQDRSSARESWKTPRQTWDEKSGDCEDTSILLADTLSNAGFDARVAIGWNGNIGQHAWVVVKAGEKQYLLESTLQKKITLDCLLELEEASQYYQPEQLFDAKTIYYSSARPDRFNKNYFDTKIWKAVPDLPRTVAPKLSVR